MCCVVAWRVAFVFCVGLLCFVRFGSVCVFVLQCYAAFMLCSLFRCDLDTDVAVVLLCLG